MKLRSRVLELIKNAAAPTPVQPPNPFKDEATTKDFLQELLYKILNVSFKEGTPPDIQTQIKDRIVTILLEPTYREFKRIELSSIAPIGVKPQALAFHAISGMLSLLLSNTPQLANKLDISGMSDLFKKYAPVPVSASMQVDSYLRNFDNPEKQQYFLDSLAAVPPIESKSMKDIPLPDKLYGFQKGWLTNFFTRSRRGGWFGEEARKDIVRSGMMYLYTSKLLDILDTLKTKAGKNAKNTLLAKLQFEGDLSNLEYTDLHKVIESAKTLANSDPVIQKQLQDRFGSLKLDDAVADITKAVGKGSAASSEFQMQLEASMDYGKKEMRKMQLGYLPTSSLQAPIGTSEEGTRTQEEVISSGELSAQEKLEAEEAERIGKVPYEIDQAANDIFDIWNRITEKEFRKPLAEYRGQGEMGGVRSIREKLHAIVSAQDPKEKEFKTQAVGSFISRIVNILGREVPEEHRQLVQTAMMEKLMKEVGKLTGEPQQKYVGYKPVADVGTTTDILQTEFGLATKETEKLIKQLVTVYKQPSAAENAQMRTLVDRLKQTNPAKAERYEMILGQRGPDIATKESELRNIINRVVQQGEGQRPIDWMEGLVNSLRLFYEDLPAKSPEEKEIKTQKLIEAAVDRITSIIQTEIKGRKFLQEFVPNPVVQ